jgi:hypothetical protein
MAVFSQAPSPHIFDHLSNIDLIYIRRGIDISLSLSAEAHQQH